MCEEKTIEKNVFIIESNVIDIIYLFLSNPLQFFLFIFSVPYFSEIKYFIFYCIFFFSYLQYMFVITKIKDDRK